MAKQPTIDTILGGPSQKNTLNKNFKAIVEKFDEMLSRATTTDTPNFMDVDLDVADATITNTNRLEVKSLTVGAFGFEEFAGQYIYKLGELECDEGAIITHNSAGDPICLDPGPDGAVLKNNGTTLVWGPDIDEDTVGVTVQEDGVTVAENVTTINFLWTPTSIVSTPAANQADLALAELLGPIWENTAQNDGNLNPSPDALFNNASEIVRVDLFLTAGIDDAEDGLSSGTSHYAIAEASNYFQDSTGGGSNPPDAVAGTWTVGTRFYGSDGSATVGSGTPTGGILQQQGSTDGGNLVTHYRPIPVGTRYVEFAWSLVPLFPLFLTYTGFSDRYTAVIRGNHYGTFETPNNKSDSGTFPTVTAGP